MSSSASGPRGSAGGSNGDQSNNVRVSYGVAPVHSSCAVTMAMTDSTSNLTTPLLSDARGKRTEGAGSRRCRQLRSFAVRANLQCAVAFFNLDA
jgi:hypothetical protein